MNIIACPDTVNNLTGQRFGRLTVIGFAGFAGNGYKKSVWVCRCDCGTEKILMGNLIKRGNTKSCGCLKREKFPQINQKHGFAFRSRQHPVYKAWKSMNWRCSPKNTNKMTYHGRGISVCQEWRNFSVFAADMVPTFKKGLTLHRINNDLGYSKENCKWSDSIEQSRERTDSRKITIDGVTRNLVDWVVHFNISMSTFYQRVGKGMNDIKALTTPVRSRVSFCKSSTERPALFVH